MTLKIRFSNLISIEVIKNLNRKHTTSSSQSNPVRFLPTPIELDIRKNLEDLGIWSLYPRYPLNLVGDSPRDLLGWSLEEPVYPINYDFNCCLWSNLSLQEIQNAVDKLKSLEYIESVERL